MSKAGSITAALVQSENGTQNTSREQEWRKNDPGKCCHSLEPVSLLLTLLDFIWSLAKSQKSVLLQHLSYQCILHLGRGHLA